MDLPDGGAVVRAGRIEEQLHEWGRWLHDALFGAPQNLAPEHRDQENRALLGRPGRLVPALPLPARAGRGPAPTQPPNRHRRRATRFQAGPTLCWIRSLI